MSQYIRKAVELTRVKIRKIRTFLQKMGTRSKKKKSKVATIIKTIILTGLVVGFFVAGGTVLWLSTLRIPDLEAFDEKLLTESTRIYDKTGEILLYNVNQDIKRSVIPFDDISEHLKRATIAIEDNDFYNHRGVKPTAFIRAVFVNILSGEFSQGGSTITQQVIKNSLLTPEKKISRKLKEWVLALKLERRMGKDEILNLYLNGMPYGGPMYGVEEASQAFYGKSAKDVTLAEAAYLASLTQAPSYYSPHGRHIDKLEDRKNLVLKRMLDNNFITPEEYSAALDEEVEFRKVENRSMKAPHFVALVREYLEDKYGEEMVLRGSLKVITTLDYSLQEKAESIVNQFALENEVKFDASNASLVAIDPKTGGVLVMVGSRDYFDPEIDGNFNIATAHRQPGSSFKPFVYAAAFNKGYTPDTILFDVETEFSTSCNPEVNRAIIDTNCYHPQNYDNIFRGPMTIRDALAQSINIPAVKALYLVGINDAIKIARDLGIQSLENKDRYGLTLVLGGGEVSLLDMTSAYSVFANEGERNPYTHIVRVEDSKGNVLEEFKENAHRVLPIETALKISDILSDNVARAPAFGQSSYLHFANQDVAVKTGTTNDYRDAWIMGYTPTIAVGSWAGNNDNTSMNKQVAGFIVAPMWRAFMDEALATMPNESFRTPPPTDPSIKPILRGIWQGGASYEIDSRTGQPATSDTPNRYRQTSTTNSGVHSILYWVDKNDPLGPPPRNPASDSQFRLWEYAVRKWANTYSGNILPGGSSEDNPFIERVKIEEPSSGKTYAYDKNINVDVDYFGEFPLLKIEYFLNGTLIGTSPSGDSFKFNPSAVSGVENRNELKVVAYDTQQNTKSDTMTLRIDVE